MFSGFGIRGLVAVFYCEALHTGVYVCVYMQQAEEASMAQHLTRQRELEVERQRVAEMQRRQREQEQFSAFEEMIRRQELEKERKRVLQEFNAPSPSALSADAPLIPGIEGPPLPFLATPSPAQSPVYPSTNHSGEPARTPVSPPAFDRSLKPGSLISTNNSKASKLFFFPMSL